MKPKLRLPALGVLVAALGGQLEPWAYRCHEASLALVRTGLLPKGARVARGLHAAVHGQHSWVTIGNPYDPAVMVVDPTIWCYTGEPPAIVTVHNTMGRYMPKGGGNYLDSGRRPPPKPSRAVIGLNALLSEEARAFFAEIAPQGLDIEGWHILANWPVGGWPAKEIIGVMCDDHRLRALIPIDVVGMLTDRNPGGLYM